MRYALCDMNLYIGFIAYGESTAKYLPYFLPSLKNQTFKDFKIIAVDNSPVRENENSLYIKNNFPEIDLKWAGENLGFAKAFNLMIARASADGAEYFLALNPDMIFEPNFIEKIFAGIKTDDKIGAVAPKILKWDFASNKKTDQVDSLGLKLNKEHRFYDSNQGESDRTEAANLKEVFGFTGAAVLLRLKALEDVAYRPHPNPLLGKEREEYFDELMFMYKEDCDLSYRLRLAGWKIILAPEAVGYHNRAVASIGESNYKIALNRRTKSRIVKQWSFLNQWILLLKIKNLPFSPKVKFATVWYQFKSLVYVLLFERFLLKEFTKLKRLLPEIKKRREAMKIRVQIKEIEKFMR
jgi:GT2 family glycosyltransferase